MRSKKNINLNSKHIVALLLIGFIILIVQLRKRNVYFHYKLFTKSRTDYVMAILARLLIFSFIMNQYMNTMKLNFVNKLKNLYIKKI